MGNKKLKWKPNTERKINERAEKGSAVIVEPGTHLSSVLGVNV